MVKNIHDWINGREIQQIAKLKTFFILETVQATNAKQPLKWQFTQTHKQLSVLFPTLITYEECVAEQIYLTQIQEN